MLTKRRKLIIQAARLFDVFNMTFFFFIAAYAVSHQIQEISFPEFLSMRVKIQNVLFFLFFLMTWSFFYSVFGLYKSRRLSPPMSETWDILKATTAGTLTLFLFCEILDLSMISATFLAVFWVGSSVSTIAGRFGVRQILKRIRIHGRNLRNVVIVGTNSRALDLVEKISSKPELGYRILGFVDNDWARLQECKKTGYPLLGTLDEIADLLRNSVVDEVLVFLPVKSHYQEASRIISLCEAQGIIVRFCSHLFDLKLPFTRTESLADEQIVSISSGGISGWASFLKRFFDLVLAAVLLVILSPLFLLTAVLIRCDSPGPVFFAQERLGLYKRRFRMYKFRTMVPEAEKIQSSLEHLNEANGPVFKIRNDPRITRVGRFLRKTSIDELPQIFNVLIGDMSFVGPRPLPVRDYEGFNHDGHRRRFSVRPGITCLWQVSGRSNISFEKWMELDMLYIDRWSLWLDMRILIKTIPAVFKGSGAA